MTDIEVIETYPDGELVEHLYDRTYFFLKDGVIYEGPIDPKSEYMIVIFIDDPDAFRNLRLNVPYKGAAIVEDLNQCGVLFRLAAIEPEIPETGDGTNLMLLISLMAVSVIGMFALRRRKA